MSVFSSHTEPLLLHPGLELALGPQSGLVGASPGFPHLLHHRLWVSSSEPGVPSRSPCPAPGMAYLLTVDVR